MLIPIVRIIRQDDRSPLIVHGSNLGLFGAWLKYIRSYTRTAFADQPDKFIFINAWNEWGEGCHLEPDQEWGLSYLEEVKKSEFFREEKPLDLARQSVVEAINQNSKMHSGVNSSSYADFYTSRSKPTSFAGKNMYNIYIKIKTIKLYFRRLANAALLRIFTAQRSNENRGYSPLFSFR